MVDWLNLAYWLAEHRAKWTRCSGKKHKANDRGGEKEVKALGLVPTEAGYDVSGKVDAQAELDEVLNWAINRKPVILTGEMRPSRGLALTDPSMRRMCQRTSLRLSLRRRSGHVSAVL